MCGEYGGKEGRGHWWRWVVAHEPGPGGYWMLGGVSGGGRPKVGAGRTGGGGPIGEEGVILCEEYGGRWVGGQGSR